MGPVRAAARSERGNGFAWTWRDDHTLTQPLRPVVHAAVDLLTTGTLDRIKVCGMEDCGTAEKIRRYVTARRTRGSVERP